MLSLESGFSRGRNGSSLSGQVMTAVVRTDDRGLGEELMVEILGILGSVWFLVKYI